MTEQQRTEAEERHALLLAAMDARLAGNQSELYRRLVSVDPHLALSTVQRWCRGPARKTGSPIAPLTLAGVLAVLGLPPDWQPPGSRGE